MTAAWVFTLSHVYRSELGVVVRYYGIYIVVCTRPSYFRVERDAVNVSCARVWNGDGGRVEIAAYRAARAGVGGCCVPAAVRRVRSRRRGGAAAVVAWVFLARPA